MARLAFLLAVVQTTLVHGLPAPGIGRERDAVTERAITISSGIDVTTSYSSPASTLQSVSITETPSITGVSASLRLSA